MRPNPQQARNDEHPGRIIYLGDVRRRRGGRDRAPDGHYLGVLALVALAGWIAWLLVLLNLQPARLISYTAFFTPLWVALAASGALVAYGIDWRRGLMPGLIQSGRRGALAASVVVLNLALLASHHWSLPVGAITLVAATTFDIFAARR